MMHGPSLVLSLTVLAVFTQCKSAEKHSKAGALQSDSVLLASIERTPCFGICPVYKITIFQSGYVVMHGKRHVPNIGWFDTHLKPEEVEAIKSYVQQNRIYELQGEYIEPRIADFPTTITELNIDNRYKRIVNTQPSAPQVLLNWEKFLDSVFNENTRWQLINTLPGDE
jgi:hypothetical protein